MGLLEESRNVVAQQGTVTPEQTMQGQLGTILDTESPLLKKARTRGMQAAQQRGLLNTSMGVEAAESAVLDVAVPIAQFDAGQMSDQAKLNQEWMNRFGQSRIQGGIDVGKIQETAEQQRQTAEQTYQQQIGAGGYSVGLIGSQAAVQSKLQEERAAQDLTAQTQSEAFQSAESAAEKEQQTAIQQSDIDARRESLASEIQSRAAMQGEQLTHDATLAEADRILRSELQAQSEAVQQSEAALQRENEIALQTERLAAQQGISIAEMENKLAMQGAQIAADESQYLADISSREGISENELANRLSLSVAEIASRENLSGNQIAHDAAMQEAKNTLETKLQVSRIASQEGISAAELENRLEMQASDIAASEAEYTARIASAEGVSANEIANRLALSAAEITSREALAGNQVTHEVALAEAKNTLESDLQAARIASQEGITTVELQNRIDLQASQITATENQYLADIASRENISTADLANRLALNAADITSRELLAGNQITHEAAVAEAKNQLELDLQEDRSEAAVAQIKARGMQDRAIESLRFAQDTGIDIPGFEGKDVYLNSSTGELTTSPIRMERITFAELKQDPGLKRFASSGGRPVDNLKVGTNGKTGRMAVQLANDLTKMEADTANRMELTAADYAAKTDLSAAEHTQFKDALIKEYGLKAYNQSLIDSAANYRSRLAAETSRMATDKALEESVVKVMSSLEETQMEQWVEINKMVFDPDDPENDETYRKQAIGALNAEYDERKVLLADAVTHLSDFDWSGAVRSNYRHVSLLDRR